MTLITVGPELRQKRVQPTVGNVPVGTFFVLKTCQSMLYYKYAPAGFVIIRDEKGRSPVQTQVVHTYSESDLSRVIPMKGAHFTPETEEL